jgi:colanic acid/amylovoran biosynthesis glycosyltransferase
MNAYPMTSTTFIRREIEALESMGLHIERHAVRQWAETLVDPRDIAEKHRTHYLLTDNVGGLLAASIREFFSNPVGVYRALRIWVQLIKNARGDLTKHVAYFMQAAYFRQLSKSKRLDHVHVHFSTNATAVAMLSHVMGGPSYSFTVHGPDELADTASLSVGLKIRNAAFVVAISEYCKTELLRVTADRDRGKLWIGRCGLALEEFGKVDDLTKDTQTFVCVGRLCTQKGQALIPAAAAILRPEFPKLKIILVGDGEERRSIEASIAAHRVEDMITLLGWLPNPEVLGLIRFSRALVLPSYAEGLPVVIMEALAQCRPVISTSIAGIPELVDDSCGWLFPAGDLDKFVGALRAALQCTPTQLAAKGKAGRERVFKLHDRRQSAKMLHKLFQSSSPYP